MLLNNTQKQVFDIAERKAKALSDLGIDLSFEFTKLY